MTNVFAEPSRSEVSRNLAIRSVALGLFLLLVTFGGLSWSIFQEAHRLAVPQFGQSAWHAYRLRDSVVKVIEAAQGVAHGESDPDQLAVQLGLALAQISAVERYSLEDESNPSSKDIRALLNRVQPVIEGGLAELEQVPPPTAAQVKRLLQELKAMEPATLQLVVDAHHHSTALREEMRERLLQRLYGLSAVMMALTLGMGYLLVNALTAIRQQKNLMLDLKASNTGLEFHVQQRTREIEFQRKLQAQILEASPSAIAVLRSSDSALMYYNNLLLKNLGESRAPPVTLGLERLFADPLVAEHVRQAGASGQLLKDFEAEVRGERPFPALVHAQQVAIGDDLALVVWLHDHSRRKELELELQHLANTDGLTGLLNRRALLSRAQEAVNAAQRHGTSFVLLVLDVDYFKRVNDAYGHPVGDQVLTGLAQIMQSSLRNVDFPGRIGGEEFAAIMPATGLAEAALVAERMRAKCAEWRVDLGAQGMVGITISIGVAEWQAAETVEQLLSRADTALYGAKHAGRNQVVSATQA